MHTLSRGECDRLANDNTLISAGRTGNIIEVNNDNEIVWHLNAKNNGLAISIYRSERIENLHPNIFSYEILNLSGEYGNYFIDYFLNMSRKICFAIFGFSFNLLMEYSCQSFPNGT